MEAIEVIADDGVPLHVAVCGSGPDVLVLSGGPGCVHYLARAELYGAGFRWWFPDPRGVARSGGGPHDMRRAIRDLECVRQRVGTDAWLVLGHSWGSDLAVRYAVDHPHRVRGVVGIAGHGLHRDRDWSAAYEAGKAAEEAIPIDWVPAVHASLWADFREWIHEATLWRRLADSPVPMTFVAAGQDIRPSWPLQQLAALVPHGRFEVVDAVGHHFWATDPQRWRTVCELACREITAARPAPS